MLLCGVRHCLGDGIVGDDMRSMFEEVRENVFKSWLLMIAFLLIIAGIGWILGWYWGNVNIGLLIAVIFTIIYTLIMFYVGDKFILTMTGAKPASKKDYPHLVHTVEGLAVAAGLPTPQVYVIDDSALNAFATGRDPKHASITVTSGLVKKMNRQELEGVVAHEMAHIRNLDIRTMMLAAVLVGVITLMSDFMLRSFLWGGKDNDRDSGSIGIILIIVGLVLAILAPLIAHLIRLAISRKREFAADAGGAILTRYPEGLASALEKIKNDPDPLVDNANRATAHLFISTPFRKKSSWLSTIFATHPPIEERIKRLRQM